MNHHEPYFTLLVIILFALFIGVCVLSSGLSFYKLEYYDTKRLLTIESERVKCALNALQKNEINKLYTILNKDRKYTEKELLSQKIKSSQKRGKEGEDLIEGTLQNNGYKYHKQKDKIDFIVYKDNCVIVIECKAGSPKGKIDSGIGQLDRYMTIANADYGILASEQEIDLTTYPTYVNIKCVNTTSQLTKLLEKI